MPITKKSGAIFAIYADSPVARSSLRSSNPIDTNESVTKVSSISNTGTSTAKIRLGGERKALGAIALAPSSRLGTDDKDKSKDKGKGKEIAAVGPTAEGSENVKGPTTTLGSRRLPPRKREVSTATAARTHGSPTKKTRSTPVKPILQASFIDNIQAVDATIEGSPATRTRSKTKIESTPVHTGSPARDLNAVLGDGRGALNAKSGKQIAQYLKAAHEIKDDDHEDENEASGSGTTSTGLLFTQELSKDDREIVHGLRKGGAISKTKGIRVAELLQENTPPSLKQRSKPSLSRPSLSDVINVQTSGGSRSTPKRTTAALSDSTPTNIKSKLVGRKGRAVMADSPLADVSEAYGASGIEPIGFRTVHKCKSGSSLGWGYD